MSTERSYKAWIEIPLASSCTPNDTFLMSGTSRITAKTFTMSTNTYYDVTHYNVIGDGVTDNTAALNTLIATTASGCELYFPRGTYLFNSVVLLKNNKNMILRGDDATLKLKNGYTGYYYDGYYGFWLEDNVNLVFENLHFDGNKANVSQELVHLRVNAGENVFFQNCKFSNSNYHSFWIAGNPTSGLYVDNCWFKDNCTSDGNDSDVYMSSSAIVSFTNCKFTRPRASGLAQAFYMSGYGFGYYANNYFDGVTQAYDLRYGRHVIDGSYGTVGVGLVATIGSPTIYARGLCFNIYHDSGTLPRTEAVFLYNGEVTLEQSSFRALTDMALEGIVIRNNIVKATVRDCEFLNFKNTGCFIYTTTGGHLVERCKFVVGSVGRGIYSYGNTGPSVIRDNVISGALVPVDNADKWLTNEILYQFDPVAINDGNTALQVTDLMAGILTMTSSTSPRLPIVPSGILVSRALGTVHNAVDWSFLNLGNQNVTISTNTNHTLVGNMLVPPSSQAVFRTRVTSNTAAVTYRVG